MAEQFTIWLNNPLSDMISMLSCENTWPHGGLRSPWLPWDMGKGTWAPWAGPRHGPRPPLQGPLARSYALGPYLAWAHGAHVPLPMSQGIQRLLRPPCGHVFSQESMEIILYYGQIYRNLGEGGELKFVFFTKNSTPRKKRVHILYF